MTEDNSKTVDPFAPSESGKFKFGMVRLHLVKGVKAQGGESLTAPFKNPYKSGDEAVVTINGRKLDKSNKGKLIIIEAHFRDRNGNKYLDVKAYLDWDSAYQEKVYPSLKVFKGGPPTDKLLPVKIELIPTGRKSDSTGKDYYDWKFAEVFKSESEMQSAESSHFGNGGNGKAELEKGETDGVPAWLLERKSSLEKKRAEGMSDSEIAKFYDVSEEAVKAVLA